jgi:hypothetical protein
MLLDCRLSKSKSGFRETKSIFAKEMKQKWMIQQPKMVF